MCPSIQQTPASDYDPQWCFSTISTLINLEQVFILQVRKQADNDDRSQTLANYVSLVAKGE